MNPDLAREKLSELRERDFEKWARVESFNAAVRFAYLDGKLSQNNDKSSSARVPTDYSKAAQAAA